jgi:WD40 repeat protein/serine/threonine protein kinase
MEALDNLCGRTLGEFVLRELIGEGGYGAVYRSEQPLLKRDVVVKVLHERRQDNEAAQDRFLREARLASQLRHPYAAHVYAFGVEHEEGLLWIAMELVQGITLDDWLETRGAMPLEQFVPFFECVAQVVQAAHERGIVHRDLKPSNMMVIESGGSLYPKLLDFGIAKMNHEVAPPMPETSLDSGLADPRAPVDEPSGDRVVTARIRAMPQRMRRTAGNPDPVICSPANGHPNLPHPGVAIGSRPYMSPEQWSDADAVGPATDVYSLGVVAYEALTGRVPFTPERTDEYHECHLHADVPPLGGDFSPDLDRVIQRALAKSPEARHRNVLELASELRAVLRAEPREQLKDAAQRWEDRARSPGLLWRGKVLAELEQWMRRAGSLVLSDTERSFVGASRQHARRAAWIWRSVVALAAAAALAGIQYRAVMQARMAQDHAVMQARLAQEQARSAQKVAEATATQAELEQGRSALLHHEPNAQIYLVEAYKHDPSPSTAFMLARALQPRLAEQARFAASSGRMWSAAFSPDGRRIVMTDDRSAQVRDAQTSRLLFTLPHGDTVYQAAYTGDGKQIVTASNDGAVRIWDAAGGSLVRKLTRSGTRPRYYVVAASPDGKLVAAIDAMGAIAHVWDAATGRLLAELRNDASEYPSLAFSADSRWLATGGGNDVRVFDARTWSQAVAIPGPRIHGLAFDPTGPRLVTATTGGDGAIWAIPSGARIRNLREVGQPIDAVAFSPDGALVVTASRDGAEQVWDARSGALRSQGNYLQSKIFSIEFDPTSKLVLAAGADGTVAIADAVLGMPVAILEGPARLVRVAHFDPSSRRVVGASWDGTARVWDATSPYRRWSSPPISDDCGLVTSFDPDRRFVAVGCRDHGTRIWDTSRDQLLAELPSVTHVDGDFAPAFPAVSSVGDRAAIARDNTVEIYELPGGKLVRTIAHSAPVNVVAFASTGHDLVSGAVDGSLLVTRDGHDPIALPMSSGSIDAAGFLLDGRVVVANARQQLRIYDPGGQTLAVLDIPARVGSLRPSPDGLHLITVPIYTTTAAPVLLDLEHYRVIARLEGHVGRVFSARWDTRGQIITAGGDGAARLWDGATGRLRQTYRGGTRFLADATVSPDGLLVVTGGADGLLRFSDTASGRLLWALEAHKSAIVGIHFEGNDIVTRAFSGEVSRWTLPKPERVIETCSDRDTRAIVPR